MANKPHWETGAQLPAASPERREQLRHPVNLRILIAVGKNIMQGRAENISLDGACLRLDETLAEGMSIAVRFLTPHLGKIGCIDVTARVQYSILASGALPHRVGVKFMDADGETRRRIAVLTND